MEAVERKEKTPEVSLLSRPEAEELAREVGQWSLMEKMIKRIFLFKDFRKAMGFVKQVADLAEEEEHHPDIFISYNQVTLTLSTHKIGGLSRKDFLLAAKIDRLIEDRTGR